MLSLDLLERCFVHRKSCNEGLEMLAGRDLRRVFFFSAAESLLSVFTVFSNTCAS